MSIKDDLLPEMVAPPPKLEPNIKEEIPDPDFPDKEEDRQKKMREKYDKEADEISNYDSEESEDEIIPEPKKRVVIPKKDIFKSVSSEESDVPQIKKVKQKRKPRGPPSEKQLEALARARAKGAETRKKKAEEKRKINELEKEVKRQEMEEKKKSLQRKLNKVTSVNKPVFKEEVEYKEKKMEEDYNRQYNDGAVAAVSEAKPPVNKKVVEDTIEKAVEKGIAEYEMKRKARKEEKKKKLEKEAYDKKVLNTVHKAIDPDAYWSQCFQ